MPQWRSQLTTRSFYALDLYWLFSAGISLGSAHQEPSDEWAGEFFGCLLIMSAGSMLVAAANEMVFLFVGLELVSIPTYVILYLSRRDRSTQEAATKYFFLSIFASGLFLYGLTFLYGTTGVSNLKALGYIFERLPILPHPQLALIAVVFVMAGLCFRVAAVPLQFYAPDVYQGSPMVVAATLAWIPKIVGFLAIVRTLTAVFAVKGGERPAAPEGRSCCSWVIAAATSRCETSAGSGSGGPEAADGVFVDRPRRLHDGGRNGRPGQRPACGGHVFWFGERLFLPGDIRTHDPGRLRRVYGAYSSRTAQSNQLTTFLGLGWTHPWPALGLSVCLLSLAGIPPLAGFWGKFQLFGSLLAAGDNCGLELFRRSGGARHVERSSRGVLLLEDRGPHVLRQAQGPDRSDRRLADCRGHGRVRLPDGLLRGEFCPLVEQGARRGASGARPPAAEWDVGGSTVRIPVSRR